ncbi:ParA family protein [Phytohabitans suffuscus]|uniref:Phage-related regulatory protein n=1 Tax=Phytohabitans suffuscus TaxID=624315 RepID=A0A6F8YGI0_9ACTN|nr:ParA family protein [Phytohabitans suffuscus]BCB85225.1 phage-related regulatory protein [Phytohabitans suffuscus]
MTSVALFNNKGGVGKTTLTYHLAYMLQRMGHRVLAVDLDPQSNLTAAFLDEDTLGELWEEEQTPARGGPYQRRLWGFGGEHPGTVSSAVRPITEGLGDISNPSPIPIADGLWLVPGDLELSAFEDRLSDAWLRGLTGNVAAIRTTTAFHRIVERAAADVRAQVVLIDVGPNLGAINRAALLAADTVLMPLAADILSLRGLQNLGPTLREWRRTWQSLVRPNIPSEVSAPSGEMRPLGYVIMQPTMRLDRPVATYRHWLARIPTVFATKVLGTSSEIGSSFEIATVRNYQSLMPMARDARKPMFDLRSADGAIGSTQTLVRRCFQDFQKLSNELLERIGPTL